ETARRADQVLRAAAGQGARLPPFVGAAVFMHHPAMRAQLDEIGRQHIYGLDGLPAGLPSLKQFLLERPRNPSHLVTPDRARQIIELVRGAKIRPSVAD